jgi:hypothetical protein
MAIAAAAALTSVRVAHDDRELDPAPGVRERVDDEVAVDHRVAGDQHRVHRAQQAPAAEQVLVALK